MYDNFLIIFCKYLVVEITIPKFLHDDLSHLGISKMWTYNSYYQILNFIYYVIVDNDFVKIWTSYINIVKSTWKLIIEICPKEL